MTAVAPASMISTAPNPGGSAAQFSLNSASLAIPLHELARGARESGFHGLELWASDIGGDTSASAVHDLMLAHDLKVSAFQLLRDYEGSPQPLKNLQLARAENLMDDMVAIGADTLLVCANAAEDSSGDRAQIVNDLRFLADMAAHRGLRIAFEPLAWSRWLNTYEEVTACILAADHPSLGWAVDAFHWFWGATPIEHAAAMPVHKCFEIQLCDAKPNGLAAIELARHHRLFPGEGDWPVAELARAFRELGFEGFFNIEVFNDDYRNLSPEEFIGRAVASINSLF